MAANHEDPVEQARALEILVQRDNDINAMIRLGCLLLYNDKLLSQRARGVQMLERVIKQSHNGLAMYCLACFLWKCDDRTDQRRAFLLFERSLKEKEQPDVLIRLSHCYLFGRGVAKDANLAVQMAERAFKHTKNADVMGNLAWTLIQAPDYRTERKRAVALYKKAIHLSSSAEAMADMMNDLGLFYHNGNDNLRKAPKRASKWYKRAIKTYKYPSAMYNLAMLLLEEDPGAGDVQRAIQLLEDAMEREQQQDELTILKLADVYLEHEINAERAIQLYETAVLRFNSSKGRSNLLGLWTKGTELKGDVGLLDASHIYNFCWRDTMRNSHRGSFVTTAQMLWTGVDHVEANQKKAMELLASKNWVTHDCFYLMLRHDLSTHPGGTKAARRLMKKINDNIDKCDIGNINSIVISESDGYDDKLLALESFRAQTTMRSSLHEIVWLAPYLRMGRHNLPFHGHPDCVTNPLRMFTLWVSVASLNLASLLLEIEGKQQEAMAILEDLMETNVRLIARLNLAYVLIKGITPDSNRTRGMELLADAVKETNDVSARAMLANALSERPDSDADDVERGWKLWRSVEEDEKDEDELRKIRRLISARSTEKWKTLACQQQEHTTVKSSVTARDDDSLSCST